MLKKILVANRGEVAIRVMRACCELGIETVAVYSGADRQSLHAKYADESFCIGGDSPLESYLNIEKIIEVAKKAGANGIHPGYGFLSQNVQFVRTCEEQGIKFIGPPSRVIALMGDKIEARKSMRRAGVRVVAGVEDVRDANGAKEAASQIGYPIMLKAAAGGGGIGIQIVWDEREMDEAVSIVKKLSLSAFGDSRFYVEKYLERPRHIEFQILSDEFGNVIHLGERECSIQRRHQKLIEECPSPIMTEELRREMGEVAIRAASAVNYINAGTVEFVYSEGEYYFIEMNTRLQVEHPVTEMTTGVDIVKEQIKIASESPLSVKQEDVKISGCAIECRINAEDPLNNFSPSYGKLFGYCSPGGTGVRVDGGVYPHWEISPFYETLVSKLIVWGRNRNEAIARMKRALGEFVIAGIKTNIPFHKAVMDNSSFLRGNLSTHFVEEEKNIMEYVRAIAQDELLLQKGAANMFSHGLVRNSTYETQDEDSLLGAETSPLPQKTTKKEGEAEISRTEAQTAITSPMPATVALLKVRVGDKVQIKGILLLLEAMKMISPVESPIDGIVDKIYVREGQLVSAGETLLTIREESD